MYTIDLVKNRLNTDLEIEGFVFTMYDARTNPSLQLVENNNSEKYPSGRSTKSWNAN